MAFKFRSISKREIGTSLSEINVTPLVDVMLVLLIIFMVTAPMLKMGIGVQLPQAETQSAPAEEGLTLTITPDMFIHLEGQPININLLETRLQQRLFNKDRKVVFIQADESLNYGYVIRVMDIAKRAGVQTVGLITEPPDRKKRRQ
jgi:biopolymer transport protein TolR